VAVADRPGVLVADDEPLIRRIVELGLERHGFRVWLAADGREAVEIYRHHRDAIAVVLLDVRMPGLDGPATLDALRLLNPDVPACFMNGDRGGYEPAALLARGGVYVIAKPFQMDNLAALLRLVANSGPAAPPRPCVQGRA
jgi:CheY-like chemotaxis protein